MKDRVGVIHDVVVTMAALAGGLWALLRFKRERSDEAALEMEVSVRSDLTSFPDTFAVFFEVTLKNVGKTKIQAKPITAGTVAYRDEDETVTYSGSLQLRMASVSSSNAYLDWYDEKAVMPIPALREIDLLSEYEIPEQNNLVDFWMEPGETYALGRTITLRAGLYLAKVTFIGARDSGDFWTRLVQFAVPVTGNSSAQ